MKEWLKKVWAFLVKVLKWMVRILEDTEGVPSSKRIQSFGLIIFGCILAWNNYSFNIVALTYGAGLGLQGITAFQR